MGRVFGLLAEATEFQLALHVGGFESRIEGVNLC